MINLKHIIKEEIENILSEGISDIVYHFTHITNLINILKTDKFITGTNLGSPADAKIDKGRAFFFSTQRSRGKSGYGRSGGNVCIVLDGRKLSQIYKGFPVDYWGWSKKKSDWDTDSEYMTALQSTEMEDRIVTDDPYIDNARRYIIEIHIMIDWAVKENDIEDMNKLAGDIPVYYYTDEEAYKLINKKKSVLPKDLELKRDDDPYERSSYFMTHLMTLAPLMMLDGRNEDEIYNLMNDYLKEEGKLDLFDKYKGKLRGEISDLYRYMYYIEWDNYTHGGKYNSITADIHNNRSNPDIRYRKLLKILVNDMRVLGVKNIKDYMAKKFKVGEKRD